METAVVIAFPELSPVVDDWREQTSADDRPSMGIPPHVTLLHPFVPAEAVADDVIDGAEAPVRRDLAVRGHLPGVAPLAWHGLSRARAARAVLPSDRGDLRSAGRTTRRTRASTRR